MSRRTTSAMIASLVEQGQRTERAPFGRALVELADERPDVVGMTADLATYTDLHLFAEAHPDRYYQMGMAEQLLFGAAAGMARVGAIPFVTTYAVFATRRAYDFIYLDIAESALPVRIACALPGLTSGYGPSHQAPDDLALMRAVPNLVVVDPADAHELRQVVSAIADHPGPVYLRLLRGEVPVFLDEHGYEFRLGRAQPLVTGGDVLICSTGLMTGRALRATERLATDDVHATVLHVPTVKPLDTASVEAHARRHPRLVVAENHGRAGGLGEAICAELQERGVDVPVLRIALPDAFLDAGALPTLHDRYGLSSERLAERIRTFVHDAADRS